VLRATFGSKKSIHSGNLALALNVDVQGVKSLNGPVAFRIGGPFQSSASKQLPKFNFTVQITASGQSFSAGAISTSDRGFLVFRGTPYAMPDAQFATFRQGYSQAQAASASRGKQSSLASLGIDPLRWLINPRRIGTAHMGGADTVHVQAGIDVGKFLDDVNALLGRASGLGVNTKQVPKGISPLQRAAIATSVKSAVVDVFSGTDDNVLRRLTIALNLDVPPALRQSAGGLSSGNVSFDVSIADVNGPQTIRAPVGAHPLAELTANTAAGSSGAPAAGSPGAAAPASGSPSAGTSPQYLSCLQKAGSDIAAVQKCAPLVGK
jgi:hypothetical protein